MCCSTAVKKKQKTDSCHLYSCLTGTPFKRFGPCVSTGSWRLWGLSWRSDCRRWSRSPRLSASAQPHSGIHIPIPAPTTASSTTTIKVSAALTVPLLGITNAPKNIKIENSMKFSHWHSSLPQRTPRRCSQLWLDWICRWRSTNAFLILLVC